MNNSLITFKPIGGVGQIGSNMTYVQAPKSSIILDCGILFPYEDSFNLNYLIPNFKDIVPPSKLIITHGHEDHIGAISHFIEAFPAVEIWAPPFAAILINKKLEIYKIKKKINIYKEDHVFDEGDFKIHPIHVNHSIPDTFGLLFLSERSSFSSFYISDFKIDYNSPYEKPFNFKKLKSLSSSLSKRILFADSTNIASSTEKTPSEVDLIKNFDELISQNSGRIFITVFSSNIHRIQTIINSCSKFNKKLVPYGRSTNNYIDIALQNGYLNETLVVKNAESLSGDEKNIVVLVSGCQGDFKSALRRIAYGQDSLFTPTDGDLFVFSSKAIPGNEKKISLLMNEISERGADIFIDKEKPVHVSGHPGKKDLLKLYQEYNPTDIVPIHGESYFLKEHCNFIKENFPQAKTYLLKNFDILSLEEGGVIKTTRADEALEPRLICGKGVEINRSAIRERRKVATSGLIQVFIILKTLEFTFSHLGLPDIALENMDKFKQFLGHVVKDFRVNNKDYSLEQVRIKSRKFFSNLTGEKPVVIVTLFEK